jgi:hypothetical protein
MPPKLFRSFSNVLTHPSASIEHNGSEREEGDERKREKGGSARQGEESTLIEENLLSPLTTLLIAGILLWLALEEVC